jgi:hypothetical protein
VIRHKTMLSNTVKCLGPEKDSGSLPSLQLSSNDGCWMLYLMVGLSEVLSVDLGNQDSGHMAKGATSQRGGGMF